MRDLARSSSFGRRGKKTRKRWAYVLGFFVLGGLMYLVGGDVTFSTNTQKGPISISDAPSDLTAVTLADQEDITAGGVSLATETAAMKDLRGGASATVKRSFGGGAYRLSVNAKLPDPVNVNYAVWLVKGNSAKLIDYMRGKGTNWSLSVSGKEAEFLPYYGVLITLERTKDNKPEEKIMSGSF